RHNPFPLASTTAFDLGVFHASLLRWNPSGVRSSRDLPAASRIHDRSRVFPAPCADVKKGKARACLARAACSSKRRTLATRSGRFDGVTEHGHAHRAEGAGERLRDGLAVNPRGELEAQGGERGGGGV